MANGKWAPADICSSQKTVWKIRGGFVELRRLRIWIVLLHDSCGEALSGDVT